MSAVMCFRVCFFFVKVTIPLLGLTVVQHMKTMMKVPMTPPMPTSQVILRKRMTPKMFWMHGR